MRRSLSSSLGLILLLCLTLSMPLGAAEEDPTLFGRAQDRYGVKPNALNFTLFSGLYTHGKDQALLDNHDRFAEVWNWGLRLGWAFHEYAEVEGSFGYTPTKTRTSSQNVYYYLLNGIGQYSVTDEFVPYGTIGFGGIQFDPRVGNQLTRFAINYGLGIKYFIFKNLAIRPEFRALTSFDSVHTAFLPSLNLTYYVAWGPAVPPDRDRDGIADSVDRCPDIRETVNGYQDEDGCPDREPVEEDVTPLPTPTPAPKPEPEPVELDVTPAPTPTPEPDTDGDGLVDSADACPDQKEVFNQYKDEDGCPDHELDEFSGRIEGITFASGSEIIQKDSYPVLNKAADILNRYPGLRLLIEGHTDNTGPKKLNQDLSESRAESVRQYLIHKGVEESRLLVKGFGETRPIASNKTPTGRTQNRRIEFNILNLQELRDKGLVPPPPPSE